MAWYYYSGNVVRSIPIKQGVSIAAQPKTKFEIVNDNVREVQVLIRKGVLKRTGKPVDIKEKKEIPVDPRDVEKVTEKTKFSSTIAEKGVTSSKTIAPVSKNKQDFTVHEEEVAKVDKKENKEKNKEADSSKVDLDDKKKVNKKDSK